MLNELIQNVVSTHSVAKVVAGAQGTSAEVRRPLLSSFKNIERMRESMSITVPLVDRIANAEVCNNFVYKIL